MNTITHEEVNDLQQLLGDDPQEQSLTSEGSLPWEEKRPLSWSEFATRLESYCNTRRWEIIFGDEDDRSLLIYAHEDQAMNGAEALQRRLPFAEEDALPF